MPWDQTTTIDGLLPLRLPIAGNWMTEQVAESNDYDPWTPSAATGNDQLRRD